MSEPMRIHRALARAGIASRRKAETLVAEGRVQVNGVVARTGQSVDPSRDRITVDGEAVGSPPARATWLVLHKPAGVMTTRTDPEGRPTVFEYVDDVPGLTYVGRLDYLTEGVLLMTTDGSAAHQLTHPSRSIERVYVATVRGHANRAVDLARRGVSLDDGMVYPENVTAEPLGGRRWAFELTITEGRTREVRRICEALDLTVERLVRTRFGPVTLGTLGTGEVRRVSKRELDMLDALARAPRMTHE